MIRRAALFPSDLIELRASGGTILIGPRSIVPSHPLSVSPPIGALNKLFTDRDAVSQLQKAWYKLGLGGVHHHHLTASEMRDIIERAARQHRINLLWIPPVSYLPITIPVALQPKPVPPPAPVIKNQPLRPAVKPPVGTMDVLERLQAAFEKALGYIVSDAKNSTAALRKAIASLTPTQKIVVVGSFGVFLIPVVGEAASALLIAYLSFRLGFAGASGVMNLVAALYQASVATSDAELDAASRRLADALEYLGEAALDWLMRGQLMKAHAARGAVQAQETAMAETRAADDVIVEKTKARPTTSGTSTFDPKHTTLGGGVAAPTTARASMEAAAAEKAGVPVPKAITSFSDHVKGQMLGRDGGVGVNQAAIEDAFANPTKIRYQSSQWGPTFQFIGKDATVALNEFGKATTAWARNSAGFAK